MYKLSILIPSLISRKDYLSRLLSLLKPQLNASIEVLIKIDSGEISIGCKRNNLIEEAQGDYVCFIDDDDRVSDEYIKSLMVGIDKNVDVVSIMGVRTENGKHPRMFIDIPYQKWETKNGAYLRGIQHLDAVKRSIASTIKYRDKSFGEDKDWSDEITASNLVKTFHQVPKPVYFYEYRSSK